MRKSDIVRETAMEIILQLQPNDKLPSEHQLMEITGFSRPTVQKALRDLEVEGVIYRLPRQGSFVADKRLHKSMSRLEGFSEELARSGDFPATRLLSFEVLPATRQVAVPLEIEEGSDVYNIVRLRSKNGDPIIIENAYFSPFAVENIGADVLTKSVYAYVEDVKRLQIYMSKQVVSACMPSEFICANLQVPENFPVIMVEETSYLSDGRPFEFSISYKNPEKYVLEITSYR